MNQFGGFVLKMLRYFEAYKELKNKFDVLPVIVANCEKNHGQIGNDALTINSTKLVSQDRRDWNVKKL